jgi:hypothetical protein
MLIFTVTRGIHEVKIEIYSNYSGVVLTDSDAINYFNLSVKI